MSKTTIPLYMKSPYCLSLTECFFPSVAMFCYGFQCNFRGPAWAVGTCSTRRGNITKCHLPNLATDGKNALYCSMEKRDSSPSSCYTLTCIFMSKRLDELCTECQRRPGGTVHAPFCSPNRIAEYALLTRLSKISHR